jgi:hypothetical protein
MPAAKPLSKAQIVAAQAKTQSNMAAARYLHVSYQHYKRYAKLYKLFAGHKNQSGKGITTKGNTGWGVKIQDLFDGKHPKYPHWKLQERIVRDGYLKQECSNCGYDDYRESDMRGPYLICFLDGDSKNHSLDNLHLLCYNCFYIVKPTGRMLSTPKNVTLLRKKLEEVWLEKDEE